MFDDVSSSAGQFSRPRHAGPRGLRLVQPGDELQAVAPNSTEAEEKFLSNCIADVEHGKAAADCAALVARARALQLLPRHFFHHAHGIVWAKICEIHQASRTITPALLAEELKLAQQLDAVGGYPFLVQLSQLMPSTSEGLRYLELVLDYAIVRQGFTVSLEAREVFHGWKGEEVEGMIGAFALKLQRLADFAMRRKRPSQRQIASNARAYAKAAMDGTLDRARQMPFGGLPHTTLAFQPFDPREEDWLILLGGVPNGGKSTVLRQHVGYNLLPAGERPGRAFVVFLLEASKERWLLALACMFAEVSVRELEETRALFPEKAALVDEWLAWLESIMEEQLWIFDDVYHVEDVERTVRQINRQVRERQLAAGLPEAKAYGIDAVLGDHIHLLKSRREDLTRRGRDADVVSYVGRTLKLLAKDLDLPNFWAAQLNRASRNEQRRPRVSDLRESGTLEQDADVVLLIHTPAENKAGLTQDGSMSVHEVELIQGKRRNGPSNVAVDLLFHKKLGRYEEVTKSVRPGAPKPESGYKREGGA